MDSNEDNSSDKIDADIIYHLCYKLQASRPLEAQDTMLVDIDWYEQGHSETPEIQVQYLVRRWLK